MEIGDVWNRIEAAAKAVGKSVHLRKGAKEADIAKAEKLIGRPFPPDFRASLLVHDGTDAVKLDTGEGEVFPWMPGCASLRPLADIVAQWKDERDYDDEDEELTPHDDGKRINNVMRHPARIPIAGSEYWDGDNTYLDFLPAANGTPGQLITFCTECDMECLGGSFGEALDSYARALESGAYVWKGTDVGPKGKSDNDHGATVFAKWLAKGAKKTPAAKPAKKTAAKKTAAKKKPPAKKKR